MVGAVAERGTPRTDNRNAARLTGIENERAGMVSTIVGHASAPPPSGPGPLCVRGRSEHSGNFSYQLSVLPE